MGRNNEFNLLSLNVRGIRTFEKRKAVFSWLVNSDADIIFLQETYSTRDIENIWRKQWKGEMLFSHGSNHSKGVLALRKDNLDFKIHSTKVDSQGRYIFLEAYIQDSPYFLLNIYVPNKCCEQFLFFKDVSDIPKSARVEQDHPFTVGGDFNIILDHVLDGQDGNSKRKDSGKVVEGMSTELDLVDIWRIRNPTVTRFTWHQEKPIIQKRLDYWLVSDSLQDDIDSVDIKTSIKSDHSAILYKWFR